MLSAEDPYDERSQSIVHTMYFVGYFITICRSVTQILQQKVVLLPLRPRCDSRNKNKNVVGDDICTIYGSLYILNAYILNRGGCLASSLCPLKRVSIFKYILLEMGLWIKGEAHCTTTNIWLCLQRHNEARTIRIALIT